MKTIHILGNLLVYTIVFSANFFSFEVNSLMKRYMESCDPDTDNCRIYPKLVKDPTTGKTSIDQLG